MKLAALWLFICLGAAGAADEPLAGFDELIRNVLAKWPIVDVQLGVVHQGRLVLAREYGASGDRSTRSGVTGILRRVERGESVADDHVFVFRLAGMAVDAAMVVDNLPSDRQSFEADLLAQLTAAARPVRVWPPINLFIDGPELSARDVVNAADYSGGGVAPSEVVVLYPANAGPPAMAAWAVDGTPAPRYSTAPLGDTRVLFDDIAAPMVYAVAGQVCAIVPYGISGRKTTQVVVEYRGVRSNPVTIPVLRSAPALFTLDATGIGQAAMLNETGCCNSVRNPAVRGTIASLYGTGDGRWLPNTMTEVFQQPKEALPPLPVRVTVGGVPAEVVWVGNVGVLQVNFRVPANAPVGDAVPLVLAIGDARSSKPVTMAVRSAKKEILVVHGEAAVRRRLTEILSNAGYDVFTARDGLEAIGKSSARNVDLVITDLGMPSQASVEMVQAMRKAHPLLKTVVVSAATNSDALRRADILQAQAVLTRPLSAQRVLQRVQMLLQRRAAVY